MEIKPRGIYCPQVEGEWEWGKRENSSFFLSHSNSLSRANEASALSNCRKKKNFCGQAMFNHSYLQSIFEKEVSKIAMVMSVKTKGIPSKSAETNGTLPRLIRLLFVCQSTLFFIIMAASHYRIKKFRDSLQIINPPSCDHFSPHGA